MNIITRTEQLISEVERRPFDRFALGPFLVWYGLKSKQMGKWPRRLIITAGIYQVFYAWNEYRKLMTKAARPKEAFTYITQGDTPLTLEGGV